MRRWRLTSGPTKVMRMPVSIRQAQEDDAVACGRIIHAAFAAVGAQHNFPPDFPSAEIATNIAGMLIGHSGFYGIVAEHEG